MRVAYFTAGTQGAGHLVRGLAIQRGLNRGGRAGGVARGALDYRMFGPALPFSLAAQPGYVAVPIDQAELRDRTRAPLSVLARALHDYAPELLLVDCYWAPLRHLLPLRGCEAWLLARWLPPRWFGGPPEARWAPGQFQRVLALEPFPIPGETDRLPPIVICNPDEARPPGSLRARLGLSPERKLRVVTHAGVPGEAAQLARASGADTFVFDLHQADALFPLAEWLGDADEISSAAGYNSFWEARWMGTASRTRFTVLERQQPEQAWRLAACANTTMTENGADVLARMIA